MKRYGMFPLFYRVLPGFAMISVKWGILNYERKKYWNVMDCVLV